MKNTNPVCKVDADGSKVWRLNGKLHRDNDLPAVEYADGTKQWWLNGELHRDNDLPAVEYADGTKAWYLNGKLHKDNGLPAVEYADGTKLWYLNDRQFTEPEYFKELYKIGKITKEELFVHLI